VPRKFQVEITPTAENDLEEIWQTIFQDCPKAASGFILHLEKQISALERFPSRCPVIPENNSLGSSFRHLIIGRYRAVFEIVKSRAIILRIIHGSHLLDFETLED